MKKEFILGTTISELKHGETVIEVAPGIFQSVADYEANVQYDEMRDNELQDRLAEEVKHQDSNIVY